MKIKLNGRIIVILCEDLAKECLQSQITEDNATKVVEDNSYNKEVVLAAVKKNGLALEFASAELRGKNWDNLSENSKSAAKEVVLAAVTQNGEALRYASDELRGENWDNLSENAKSAAKEVVLTAVKQNGLALEYASEELRGFYWDNLSENAKSAAKEVVLNAVNNNYQALFASDSDSDELRSDKNIQLSYCVKKLEACNQDKLEACNQDNSIDFTDVQYMLDNILNKENISLIMQHPNYAQCLIYAANAGQIEIATLLASQGVNPK